MVFVGLVSYWLFVSFAVSLSLVSFWCVVFVICFLSKLFWFGSAVWFTCFIIDLVGRVVYVDLGFAIRLLC